MKIKEIALLFFLCFMSACSSSKNSNLEKTAQILNETPTPNFVIGTRYDPDANQICALISPKNLWRPGDNAAGLTQHIIDSSKVTLDDTEVKPSVKSYNEIYPVGENGKIVGTYGGNIEICFYKLGLSAGFHVAVVKFKTSSGEEYSYSWSFET